jgi:excisionase family DNA binding protein
MVQLNTENDDTVKNTSIRNAMPIECEKLTITVPEAGRALGIGRNTAYAAARTGELPTLKIGKRLLVPVVALKRLLTEPKSTPPSSEN